MNITRTRLDRIIELDRQIRAGKHPNCTTFSRHWADKIGSGENVDRKTIQRDIDWLRDMQRAPIEWSTEKRGYYYRDPSWAMPFVRITDGELLSLLLARQMGMMYKDTPMAKSIDTLFHKILNTLSDPVNVDPIIFGEQFSFHSHPSRPISTVIWNAAFKALRENRILRIAHRPLGDKKEFERDIEPVHLANVDDDWYLVAFCLERNAWRSFSLSRIVKAKTINRTFIPRDFNPQKHFENRFGKFIAPPGNKPYMVKLLFSARMADHVLERIWHKKQTLKNNADGSVLLTLPIPSLIEAKRFALGWGSEVEVLEPIELRQEISSEMARLRKLYPPSKN